MGIGVGVGVGMASNATQTNEGAHRSMGWWVQAVKLAAVVGAGACLWRQWDQMAKRVQELEFKRDRLQAIKQAERIGRIEAEKQLRQLRCKMQQVSPADIASSGSQYYLKPIGRFTSCFPKRSGTPRQPFLVSAAKARLVLDSALPKDILSGLELYSHCWLIFIFHQNTNLGQKWEHVKGKVQVPRLNGGRLGVFATRSPHRPNAIGLSTAKVVSVKDRIIEFSGVDLVDGSPILDIKPYVPFCDMMTSVSTPDWVQKDCENEPLHISDVIISVEAKEKLQLCWNNINNSLYETFEEFLTLVDQVLGRDIRSVYQRMKGDQSPFASPVSSPTKIKMNGENIPLYHLHLETVDISYIYMTNKEIHIVDAAMVERA